jgi:hypothetical protein
MGRRNVSELSSPCRDVSCGLRNRHRMPDRKWHIESHYPTQAREGLPLISCHAVPERSACAPFIKERRIKCVNVTGPRSKSGQMGHPARPAFIN